MFITEDQVTNLMDLLKIPVEKRNFVELRDHIQNLIEENDNLTAQIQSKNGDIQSKTNVSPLEKILNNPGLVNLAENIFGNLADEDVEVCRHINQSSKQILDNPLFWLRKIRGLSKESKKDWIKIIQSVKNSDHEKVIISYLKWNLKKEVVVDLTLSWYKKFKSLSKDNQKDWIKAIETEKNSEKKKAIIPYLLWNFKKEALVALPCYTSPAIQDDFRKIIRATCEKWVFSDEDTEIVKIFAPLTDNPNAPDEVGWTPIHMAALSGITEIVEILAPLTDNPNAPDKDGETPIYWAARNEYTEIGHTEIVKILALLTENPNAPNNEGDTPIHQAAVHGHTEIVKILAPLTDNPNAPDKYGYTPSSITYNAEIRRFLKCFNTSRKRKAGPSIKPSKKRAKKF